MSSYEKSLKDLERELDQKEKRQKDSGSTVQQIKKKEGFVRTVGFSADPPSTSPSPQRESALASRSSPRNLPLQSYPVDSTAKEITSVPLAAPSPSTTPKSSLSAISPPQTKEPLASSAGKQPAAAEPKAPKKEKEKEKKGPPAPGEKPPPKQKRQSEMTKAERRELQEKQRAEKAAAKGGAPAPAKPKAQPQLPKSDKPSGDKPATAAAKEKEKRGEKPDKGDGAVRAERQRSDEKPDGVSLSSSSASGKSALSESSEKGGKGGGAKGILQYDDAVRTAKAQKRKILKLEVSQKQVPLFAHLPQYERNSSLSLDIGLSTAVHPSVVKVGLRYADGTITGSNARCVGMLTAFKDVISDFTTPEGKVLARVLDLAIKPYIQFLVDCRPISVSMANAINYLKLEIASTAKMTESDAKKYLLEKIDQFIEQRVLLADEVIAAYAVSKINNGDVILTHACSHVIELTLRKAHDARKRFRVVVVDSRPRFEGKALLKRLLDYGIECTYILINAISYIMKDVTKVMVGAATMMNNGSLLSRVGTAVVAMMAHAYHIPFLVCCETYKFNERVQLDSICYNDLGNPDDLKGPTAHLNDWKSIDKLRLLNLGYDVTPTSFIMMVITEYGMIPPTSVPVVIREYQQQPPSYLE